MGLFMKASSRITCLMVKEKSFSWILIQNKEFILKVSSLLEISRMGREKDGE